MADTRLSPGQQMMASCAGALITSFVVTPFDVVKTRMQAQQSQTAARCAFDTCSSMDLMYGNRWRNNICACNPHPVHFRSTTDAFVKIFQQEGSLGLWRGLSPTLLMSVPATMVYFTGYDQLKTLFHHHFNALKLPYGFNYNTEFIAMNGPPMFAGIIARTVAVTLISPIELFRTKLQAERLSIGDLSKIIAKEVSHEGVRSLWRGLPPTLLRDVPFSAVYWVGYEATKTRLLRHYELHVDNYVGAFGISFASGAVSGIVAAALTVPFDVIKTHRQMQIGRFNSGNLGIITGETTWEIAKSVVRMHGFRGLLVGLSPRVAKVAPACAIMISSYEIGKLLFAYKVIP